MNVRGDDPTITNNTMSPNVWDTEGTELASTSLINNVAGDYKFAVEFTRDDDGPNGDSYTRFEFEKVGTSTSGMDDTRVSNSRYSSGVALLAIGVYSGSFSYGSGTGEIATGEYPRAVFSKIVIYSE